MNLNDIIDDYYERRAAHERADHAAKQCYHEMKAAEAKLVDAMLEAGMPSVKRFDGTAISLRKNVSLSVTKDNSDQIRTWLIATVGDDKDFVEEVVAKSAITELVKQQLEEGLADDDFPIFLKVSTRPGISVRGWNNISKIES